MKHLLLNFYLSTIFTLVKLHLESSKLTLKWQNWGVHYFVPKWEKNCNVSNTNFTASKHNKIHYQLAAEWKTQVSRLVCDLKMNMFHLSWCPDMWPFCFKMYWPSGLDPKIWKFQACSCHMPLICVRISGRLELLWKKIFWIMTELEPQYKTWQCCINTSW